MPLRPPAYWQQVAARRWQSSVDLVAMGDYESAKREQDIASRTYAHARWWMKLQNGRTLWDEVKTHTNQPTTV